MPPIISGDDFHGSLRREVRRRRARRQWGPWRLDVAAADLAYIRGDGCLSYSLDLLAMHSAAAVTEALAQVRSKIWCSSADLGDLVAAIDDIFGLRPTFSGGAIDPGRYLRSVYGERAEPEDAA